MVSFVCRDYSRLYISSLKVKSLGAFCIGAKQIDTETPEIKGWRSFKFVFGSKADREEREESDITPTNSEQLAQGCYHTLCDYDAMDRN